MKFLYYYSKDLYSKEECEDIFQCANDNVDYLLKDRPADNKNVRTFLVRTKLIEHKLEKFFEFVEQANNEVFGFHLHQSKPVSVNMNTYLGEDQGDYPYHRDAMPLGGAGDIKLTAILNLSPEPYLGGDFQIFDGKDNTIGEIAPTGSILVFPSFWYHRVTPVTNGRRVTMSCWFNGPNWR